MAGIKEDDRKLCGARLAGNLRGEAARICETLATESVGALLDLQKRSVPERSLRNVPHLYDLFRKTFFSAPRFRIDRTKPGRSSMDVYLDELAYSGARVSDSILGYCALLRSDLTKSEKCHVLALANTSYSFPQLGQILRDLYPEGSRERRHLQPHSAAACSVDFMDEEESVDSWGDVAEDSADQKQADGLQAVLAASPENLTDDAIAFAASDDPELASALVTLREAHTKLHKLKKARSYFCATFDGTFRPEATAADRRQARPGGQPRPRQPRTGSGKRSALVKGPLDHAAAASSSTPPPSASAVGDQATPEERPWKRLREHTRCLVCGRLGHWRGDPECSHFRAGGSWKVCP